MRVALYVRTAAATSADDRGEGNAESQLAELREYAAANKFEIVREYVDHGWSGLTDSRPELDHMAAAAARGEFDLVLVATFDRIARSHLHLDRIVAKIREAGVGLLSKEEGLFWGGSRSEPVP